MNDIQRRLEGEKVVKFFEEKVGKSIRIGSYAIKYNPMKDHIVKVKRVVGCNELVEGCFQINKDVRKWCGKKCVVLEGMYKLTHCTSFYYWDITKLEVIEDE